VVLLIRQHLVANHGVALNQVKTIYSHPIANAQCSKFLSARPWQVVNYLDTASCVEKLAKEDLMDAAAIAGKRAVEIYNMNILKEDVQNSNTNYTRFFIIGPDRNTREGNKTSMVLGLRNGLNSLHDYLGCFVKREIRILKIDSRPSRRLPFEYVIYMDISGTPQEQKVKDAISDLWQICGFVRFIGSYEAAKIPS
jgi:chorismate mutase/prephenate dehydratase